MDPLLAQIGPLRLWYYGLAYAIGLLTIHLWVYARREHLGYDRRDVAWFSVFFGAGVLAGGRLFDVALYEWFYYREHPWQVFRLWEGGMATHGVLLGAVVGTALFCRLRNKSLLEVADEVVIPGAVLMALGRLGNHINGEVYGSVTGVPWAMSFPYAEGCRHPVALYDGAKNLLLVPILLAVKGVNLRRHRLLPRGILLGHFVFWYASLRLFVDLFREYDSYWLGVGRGQYFNVLMAAAGLAIIAASRRYARRVERGSKAEPAPGRTNRPGGPSPRAPAAVFYALVALCLTIPSGWTQQVLQGFEADVRAASSVPAGCEGDNAVRGESGLLYTDGPPAGSWDEGYGITRPPSQVAYWPVTKSAQGDANIRTARAMSSGVPRRPRGVEDATWARTSSVAGALASVSPTRPPATMFTVTLWEPSSEARLREKPKTALFAVV